MSVKYCMCGHAYGWHGHPINRVPGDNKDQCVAFTDMGRCLCWKWRKRPVTLEEVVEKVRLKNEN
jgi:hypothetical protein